MNRRSYIDYTRPIAVVLGLGTNGLACVRALAYHGAPIIILEEEVNRDQVHLKTRYGEKYILQSLTGSSLLTFLEELGENHILFPTTDRQVSWLSANRHLLPGTSCLLFPSHETINRLMDKLEFFDFCIKNNFHMAPYAEISNANEIEPSIKDLRFPLIIKTPQKVYSNRLSKAYIVSSLEELKGLWGKIKTLNNRFIIQEFIPGGDSDVYFCLQYISQDGQLLASFTGRKIRQWKPLCGGTASCEPVHEPRLTRFTFDIFKRAGFWGIGSVEFKRDHRDGRFYIIEPTICRTDFQEQVAIANGVNIPWIAYQDATKMPVTPVIKEGGKRAWMHIMHDRLAANYYIQKEELTRISWFVSLLRVRSFDLLSLSDPKPALVAILRKIKRKFLKIEK